MRVARQGAAATLRGDGEQAAGGDGDDGLAAPLSVGVEYAVGVLLAPVYAPFGHIKGASSCEMKHS